LLIKENFEYLQTILHKRLRNYDDLEDYSDGTFYKKFIKSLPVHKILNSKIGKNSNTYELNIRSVLAMRIVGGGLVSLRRFCGVMNFPAPVQSSMIKDQLRIKEAEKQTEMNSKEARRLRRQLNISSADNEYIWLSVFRVLISIETQWLGPLNSDGSPIFESSKFAMWPIQMIVNDVPFKIRYSEPITCGIWFGKH
ncbi:hypothetical protein TSAR_016258, partial [Trichomalopsis sarcophagae]